MDSKSLSSSRTRKSRDSQRRVPFGKGTRRKPTISFSDRVFESELRRILSVCDSREPGEPGSTSVDLASSRNPLTVASEYLIGKLMSKYDPGTKHGLAARKAKAMERFWEGEETCFWQNIKFSQETWAIDRSYPALHRARQLISSWLHDGLTAADGPLERISRGFGWGPGASTRLPRARGDACYKYSGSPEVSPNAYSLAEAAICSDPSWIQELRLADEAPVVTWGSRLDTVPKNSETERVICVEPDLNMYLQKGLGKYLRDILRTVGCDLNDQSNNQDACAGDAWRRLATVDLSMASDTVSQGLVRYLFPPWLTDFVAQTRSEFAVLPDGTLHRLCKVSSMGNGYTFELESMIFYAIALSVTPTEGHNDVWVYGDDIIVPRESVPELRSVLEFCGFTFNAEKSYSEGYFRESCGVHFYRGYDVTPFYVRRPTRTLEDLFLLHNNLQRWVARLDRQGLLTRCLFDNLNRLLSKIRSLAPAKWRRPRLPDGYGDGAFIGSFSHCNPKVNKDGWEYFDIVVWEESPAIVDVEVPGLLVKALHNLHKRKRLDPKLQIWEPTFGALPSSGRGRRECKIHVPWAAFG